MPPRRIALSLVVVQRGEVQAPCIAVRRAEDVREPHALEAHALLDPRLVQLDRDAAERVQAVRVQPDRAFDVGPLDPARDRQHRVARGGGQALVGRSRRRGGDDDRGTGLGCAQPAAASQIAAATTTPVS
jgi:hypothetical protein